MKYSVAAFVAAMAGSALGSPAPAVTPAPRAAATTCSEYATTTSYTAHACPLYCVEPGSPLCPKIYCPAIAISCAPGSTLTAAPAPAPTTIIGTVTEGCTVTVEAERGCAICGCLGCPTCLPVKP
ncbi:44b37930-fab1-4bb4-b413-b2f83b8207d6 [Thermothielavioides terrestris]|uniref:Uncharacterized protein n=2 Tax=Thermothielavioides terrestris TaxID=2587410 RepID=G2R5W1_THETT|nr:uncharacterized protein THITE_2117845 [Thermothielavioides terrestris NRRL 8126]AEO68348.1 hypothetical protein THITE_2117845 [Thermothielavioides terrestris NRRL 8126]SPQ24378.1 44b37930-fab1-4bb4-b413-b2f83b8207d6 [Thermothielavioides terrestris]